MDSLTIRGVPRGLALDGWWLVEESAGSGAVEPLARTQALPGRRVLVLLALVLLADFLFWKQEAGLSLALYAFAVLVGFMITGAQRRDWKLPLAVFALSALPVIEHVQLLSFAFLLGGLLTALALLRWPAGTAAKVIAGQGLRLFGKLIVAPFAILYEGLASLSRVGQAEAGLLPPVTFPALKALVKTWALPLGGALILLSLMIEANPVLERTLSDLTAFEVSPEVIARSLFWLGVACFLWPLLSAKPKTLALPELPESRPLPGVNAASVLRALWLFNGILAVQTVMDLSILVGNGSLPEGMSHAEYAHRGAYPLVVTAMLAGVFALMARPFVREHRALLPLLLLWLGQNVLLCASSALRLELYVGVYGLTYLRLHAMIWMALVAAGLGLIGWQVVQGRGNGWLALRLVGLGLATLYAACFVNFAEIVARQQLYRAWNEQSEPDISYVCDLGPMAAVAWQAWHRDNPGDLTRGFCSSHQSVRETGWRDWGWRKARVRAQASAIFEAAMNGGSAAEEASGTGEAPRDRP